MATTPKQFEITYMAKRPKKRVGEDYPAPRLPGTRPAHMRQGGTMPRYLNVVGPDERTLVYDLTAPDEPCVFTGTPEEAEAWVDAQDDDLELARAVVATLSKHGHREVSPVTITIGRFAYVGASYIEREEGDQRFYLLGEVPPSSRRSTVYRLPDDDGDWFVGGYMERARVNEAVRQFHPHGAWFLLMRWPHETFGKRIDANDDREMKRMDIRLAEPTHA